MSKSQQDLSSPRKRIDEIDHQILELLHQRQQTVQEVIQTKIKTRLPIFVADREEDKVRRFREEAARFGLDAEWAEDLLRLIMGSSRASQSSGQFPNATDTAKTVLIVGGAGGM